MKCKHNRWIIATLSAVAMCLLVPAHVAGQATPPEPNELVLVGKIVKMSRGEITITALNNPRFTKVFRIEAKTEVVHKKEEIDSDGLRVDSVIVVKQNRDRQGERFRTERIRCGCGADLAAGQGPLPPLLQPVDLYAPPHATAHPEIRPSAVCSHITPI